MENGGVGGYKYNVSSCQNKLWEKARKRWSSG